MTCTTALAALAPAALLMPYALAMLLVGCDQLKSLLPKSECEHATEKLCAVKEWEHVSKYEELVAGNWCAERERLEAASEAAETRFRELQTWSEEKNRLFSEWRPGQSEITRANNKCIETRWMAKGFDMEACFSRELMACVKKQ
jgi:hypothetical protein